MDSEEEIPGDIPVSRGNFMSTHLFVEANHSGDTDTILYQNSIVLFCKNFQILWFRNRHKSVEA